jgi:hypothetical protein
MMQRDDTILPKWELPVIQKSRDSRLVSQGHSVRAIVRAIGLLPRASGFFFTPSSAVHWTGLHKHSDFLVHIC